MVVREVRKTPVEVDDGTGASEGTASAWVLLLCTSVTTRGEDGREAIAIDGAPTRVKREKCDV